jgi:hypothetical protein
VFEYTVGGDVNGTFGTAVFMGYAAFFANLQVEIVTLEIRVYFGEDSLPMQLLVAADGIVGAELFG